jgi:hypothetical protein
MTSRRRTCRHPADARSRSPSTSMSPPVRGAPSRRSLSPGVTAYSRLSGRLQAPTALHLWRRRESPATAMNVLVQPTAHPLPVRRARAPRWAMLPSRPLAGKPIGEPRPSRGMACSGAQSGAQVTDLAIPHREYGAPRWSSSRIRIRRPGSGGVPGPIFLAESLDDYRRHSGGTPSRGRNPGRTNPGAGQR